MSASFSASGIGTATASATAQPGTYSLFVEQVATQHQVAYEDLPAVPVAMGGSLNVNVADGSSFSVNLSAADSDGDGTLSQAEIARAINQAAGNAGKATAMVVTVGGTMQLMISSGKSGAAGAVSLDTSGMPASTLKDALNAGNELVAAQDAVVWLGAQGSGVKLQQGSNTFTAIPGVTMTFTQAMAPASAPMTLTVGNDDATTQANVQGFVDAYNSLKKVLDELTSTGDAQSDKPAAAFATDAGVRALRARLNNLVRQDFGGLRLMDFGISADRYGSLSLNGSKLKAGLAAHPDGLSTVFGQTGTSGTGVLGAMDVYLDSWLDVSSGHIKQRKESVQNMQRGLTTQQTRLDNQFNQYYERYLQQFSRLNSLQSQMTQTSGLLSNLFPSTAA
ncbi:MAG: flagellar filament capping protein FliD [Aquabacterium sp.]